MALEQQFEAAKQRAMEQSKEHGCVQHVNAILEVHGSLPVITGFTVSDWHDGSTLITFSDGEEC